ncbi:MAG: PIN domain-containing protein [Vulcanimicrobiaceae bacterium]
MLGLDTNVIVRILTGDDARRQQAALAFLRANCSNERPGWVNRIVAVEIAWILERLLHTAELRFENHDALRAALAAYRQGADLADALLGEINREKTCTTTITFDRRAAGRLPTFTLLDA